MNYKGVLYTEHKFNAICIRIKDALRILCENCYIRYLKSETYLRGLALNSTGNVMFEEFDIDILNDYIKHIDAKLCGNNDVYFDVCFSSNVLSLSFNDFFNLFGLIQNNFINYVLSNCFDDEGVDSYIIKNVAYNVDSENISVDTIDADLWRFFNMPLFEDCKKKPVIKAENKEYVCINLNDIVISEGISNKFRELVANLDIVGMIDHNAIMTMTSYDAAMFCNKIVLYRDRNYLPYPAGLLYNKLQYLLDTNSDLVIAIEDGKPDILTYMKHFFKDIEKRIILF